MFRMFIMYIYIMMEGNPLRERLKGERISEGRQRLWKNDLTAEGDEDAEWIFIGFY